METRDDEHAPAAGLPVVCSIRAVKKAAYASMRNNRDKAESVASFWSLIKQRLLQNGLAIEDGGESRQVEREQLAERAEQLRNAVRRNARQIEEMTQRLVERVRGLKEMEAAIGRCEATPQEMGMVELSVEMIREINRAAGVAVEKLRVAERCRRAVPVRAEGDGACVKAEPASD